MTLDRQPQPVHRLDVPDVRLAAGAQESVGARRSDGEIRRAVARGVTAERPQQLPQAFAETGKTLAPSGAPALRDRLPETASDTGRVLLLVGCQARCDSREQFPDDAGVAQRPELPADGARTPLEPSARSLGQVSLEQIEGRLQPARGDAQHVDRVGIGGSQNAPPGFQDGATPLGEDIACLAARHDRPGGRPAPRRSGRVAHERIIQHRLGLRAGRRSISTSIFSNLSPIRHMAPEE